MAFVSASDADAEANTETEIVIMRNSASSFHWLSSSIFSCSFVVVPHCNISSYLHYMMFQTIQTIYFLWGYDPGNMSVSFIADLSPVYCCLVFWSGKVPKRGYLPNRRESQRMYFFQRACRTILYVYVLKLVLGNGVFDTLIGHCGQPKVGVFLAICDQSGS